MPIAKPNNAAAAWCGVFIWLPVLASLAAVMLDWHVAWVLSIAGVCALLATWILLARILSPRDDAADELARAVREMEAAAAASGTMSALRVEPAGDPAMRDTHAADLVRSIARRLREDLPRDAIERTNLRAIVDGLPDPTLATDERGMVLAANRACADFFGPRSAPLGRYVEDLFTQPEVMQLHAEALRGTLRRAQVRVPRPGVVKVYEVVAVPIPIVANIGGSSATTSAIPMTGALLTLRDVTELALAVQLKTDFVANASHELRTPLASIKAAVETIRDGARDDPAMLDRLTAMIASNALRLEDLVRDLMDLSKLESPEAPVRRERVYVSRIAEAVAAMFEPICREKRLTISIEVRPEAEELESDRDLLMLILKNLVENATKFAFEGTTIRVTAERAGGGVRLRVIDQGVGIPFAQQQRIFERFYQVDGARTGAGSAGSGGGERRGTGLGLAIVKHAVKRLGGTIGVESVWQRGTTMTVEIG